LPKWDSTLSQLQVLVRRKSSLDSRLSQSTSREIKCLDWNNRTAFNWIFEGNLTAARYLNFLRFDLVPARTAMFPNDHEEDHIRIFGFNKMGRLLTLESLSVNILTHISWKVDRTSRSRWPPRSPDLTLLDFFVWSYLKPQKKFILIDQIIFCTHSLGSDASNIQRSISNEFFPIDSNVKIAKNTGPLRH
jgi:hypothetical protein